jgi:hypothetical protein
MPYAPPKRKHAGDNGEIQGERDASERAVGNGL